MLAPFFSLPLDSPPPITRVGPHRASALCNPLIHCFPRPSTAFPPSNPCYANFASICLPAPSGSLLLSARKVLRWGWGSAAPGAPRTLCGKGALPVEHLAHWAEFWAKKRPRKMILGQSFRANFSGLRCRRGGHPVVPSGPAGCTGVWGRWPVGYLHELAPGSGSRGVVPKP